MEDLIKIIEQEGLQDELNRIKKLLRRFEMDLKIYQDEEDGNPENKYLAANIYRPDPDGLVFIATANKLDEILRLIEDYINHYKTINDLE